MLLLLGCAPHPAPPPPPPPVEFAAPPRVDGVTPMPALPGATWWPLAQAGAAIGGERFGGDAGDLADGMDANTVVRSDGKLWLVTHFERAAGAIYVTELARVAGAGFAALSTRPVAVDDGPVYNPCGASLSPWGTHLGSEEYEPDAAVALEDGRIPLEADRGRGVEREFDYGWNQRWTTVRSSLPYHHGWATEVALDGADTSFRRLLALGRFSHEQQLALPDRRTVYLSDDLPHGGALYRFVADHPDSLARGRLAAAAFTPAADPADPARLGTMRWVDLGPSDEATAAARWSSPPLFSELFDRTVAGPTGCTSGTYVDSGTGRECLTVRPGADDLARAFETRRYAGVLGATTTFPKEEGLAWDHARGVLYVAWSSINDEAAARLGLPANVCGQVVAVDPASGAVRTATAGVPRPDGTCGAAGIANPDNIAWAPELDALFIAEDGRRRGGENWLWMLRKGRLTPVLRGSPTAEVSGLAWTVIDGEGWLTIDFQEEGSTPSKVGMLGPIRP